MIKGVLFDMDGVLVDSERVARDTMTLRAAELGYTVDEAFYTTLLGCTRKEDIEKLNAAFGKDFPAAEMLDRVSETISDQSRKGVLPLKDGLTECMSALRAADIRIALVSSTARAHVEARIAAIPALQNIFDALVCGGDIPRGKPYPDPFLLGAKKLGLLPSECLGVEDGEAGLRSLHDAGIASVMIPDLLPYGERVAPFAQYKINSLRELPQLIGQLNGHIEKY